jgi:hypothetical protein
MGLAEVNLVEYAGEVLGAMIDVGEMFCRAALLS